MSEGLSYEEAYKTASSIALPGRSEHNAGLAADLKGDDWDCDNWYNFEKFNL